jgi:chromosomal replication initiator protein
MDGNLSLIWNHIATAVQKHVSASIYQRWFQVIELRRADESRLTLRVPDQIYQLWIESNYMPLLQSSITDVLGSPREIDFCFSENECGPAEPLLPPVRQTPPAKASKLAAEAAAFDAEPAAGTAGMNTRYTFDTFVVGTNNQFAHAASLAVAQAPARTYNPLFIHGGVGLGKTHLMQAVGQYVHAQKKGGKVLYVSSERFTNEFIDAIQNSNLVRFRKRYRQADVLLIDDIQFLAGKERSQEEFFHTFNTLFDGHKQIVLSSDRPPTEIQNLEQRLVSRFEWGLTAELQPPDVETRLAILRKKTETMKIKIAPEVLDFLAQRIRTNVRRLEGALMRVGSFASLHGGKLGTEEIERLLKDILQEEARRTVTIDQIQRKVAEYYDVRIADMTSKRRPANIAFPRQVAMFLARELTKASLNEIGEAFGGRDHGTVLHAHRLVRDRIQSDNRVKQSVSFLDTQLNR